MSYELNSERTINCPCRKGHIIEKNYNNDWNQYKRSIFIDCPKCKKLYNVQSRHIIHGDHSVEELYLVLKHESINSAEKSNNCVPFSEQLCMRYPLEILIKVYDHLVQITNIKNLSNFDAKRIARDCKQVVGTMKISTLKNYLQEAILNYDAFDMSWDKEKIRIDEVLTRSILIPF